MNIEHELKITEPAFIKIKRLMDEEITEGLRIFIQGGGCSGFSYGFDLAKEIAKDDIIISKDGANVVIDPMSMMYLEGATVDYKIDMMAEQFTINNPSAKSTCGCGSSFSLI